MMIVDRPAIASLVLRCTALCSRRRVALFVTLTALIVLLLLNARRLSGLHAFGLQLMPHRWPVTAAHLSLGLEGDRAVIPKAAGPAAGTADKNIQAMIAVSEQATAASVLQPSSSADNGRAVTVPSAEAATSSPTAWRDLSQWSSAVSRLDLTVHAWSTARSSYNTAISLSAIAAVAADAALKRSTESPHTVIQHDSGRYTTTAGDARFRANASIASPAGLTSLAIHEASYAAIGTSLNQFVAGAAAVTAATASAVQTATTPGSPSYLTATRPILYIRFIDPLAGLGNKMFQYASGVGLALRHGAEARLVVDHAKISTLLASMRIVFCMTPLLEQPKAPSPADAVTLAESGWGRYDAAKFDKRSSFELHNTTVVGYLQSWRYFEPVAGHIRSEFALSPRAASLADGFLRRSVEGGKAAVKGNGSSNLFVGIHVRRGDMLNNPMLYNVAPPEFLLKAMDHYVAKYGFENQLTFVIGTNDHDWVKNFVDSRLPKHFRVLRLQFTPEEDMAVLSRCNHSIVTAGTFGWWSAWLAGGDVVYYKDFIRLSSPLYAGHVPSDYYPPHWLGLS